MTASVKLSLVHGNSIFREGLRRIFIDNGYAVPISTDDPDFIIENMAENGSLVVIDVDLALADDCRVVTELLEAEDDNRVVVLGGHVEIDVLNRLYTSGAHGYILDDAPYQSLLTRVELVLMGQRIVPPTLVEAMLTPGGLATEDEPQAFSLNRREQAVLEHLAQGQPNKEISRQLGVSEPTVKLAMKMLFRKLDVSNRTQAAMIAQQHGLVPRTRASA